jgi:ornithine carbamoyltransferase
MDLHGRSLLKETDLNAEEFGFLVGPGESQLGYKESVKATARVLGRMFDGIEYRGFTQESIEILGQFAGVPASVAFDQAENRMHTIKALMLATLGEGS